jgi:hypothetical protein
MVSEGVKTEMDLKQAEEEDRFGWFELVVLIPFRNIYGRKICFTARKFKQALFVR